MSIRNVPNVQAATFYFKESVYKRKMKRLSFRTFLFPHCVLFQGIMVDYLAPLVDRWSNPFGVRGLAKIGFEGFFTPTPISMIV